VPSREMLISVLPTHLGEVLLTRSLKAAAVLLVAFGLDRLARWMVRRLVRSLQQQQVQQRLASIRARTPRPCAAPSPSPACAAPSAPTRSARRKPVWTRRWSSQIRTATLMAATPAEGGPDPEATTGGGPTPSRPPYSATRSRMPIRPCPPCFCPSRAVSPPAPGPTDQPPGPIQALRQWVGSWATLAQPLCGLAGAAALYPGGVHTQTPALRAPYRRPREGCAKSMWPVTCWFVSDGSSVR
jgi:hypothetical protein